MLKVRLKVMLKVVLTGLLGILPVAAGMAVAATPAGGPAGPPAAATAPATAPAAVDNQFLAPFIDDQTIAVLHVDVARIDTAALAKYLGALMDDAKVPAQDDRRAGLTAGIAAADAYLARFKQLGGRHVYALLSHPDLWPHMQPAAFLVKIEPGGNIGMMKEFLTANLRLAKALPAGDATPENLAEGEGEIVQLRDDLLFVGQDYPLKRLASLRSVPRPELALADGGDSGPALEAVAALTPDERRALRELMPTLPAEVGGGSTEFLTREGLRARLEIALPPTPAITLSIARPGTVSPNVYSGSTTINAGGRLGSSEPEIDDLIVRLRDLLLASPGFNDELNPDLKPQAAEIKGVIKEVLTPFSGRLTLQDRQIRQLMPLVGQGLVRAQEEAGRAQSAANIHSLLVACEVYAGAHNNALPESLDVLVKSGSIPAAELFNPIDGKPYVYRALFPTYTPDSAVPVIWEERAGEGGLNVGYADDHVEWVASQKMLDEQISQAQARKAPQDAPHKP